LLGHIFVGRNCNLTPDQDKGLKKHPEGWSRKQRRRFVN